MAGSRLVVRRLGLVGVAALVLGGVLLGTGVAVSAKTVPLAAAANKKKPTTTTTSTTTTTVAGATTTTTEPCNPANASANATAGDGTGTATVSPATCLLNGTSVTISATGLMKKSGANFLGTILECNNDPTQPTVLLLGHAIPVSCTGALAHDFTPNAAGTFTGTLSIIEGTTGPPVPNENDSAGVAGNVDAANYPCPPTPAQVTAGDTCVVAIGDTGGDEIAVPVSFNPNIPPPPAVVNPNPTTTTAPATQTAAQKAAAAKAAATKASSSSLAFTGTGPGLWWLALVGVLLMIFGGILLAVVDEPRRLLRLLAVRRATRSRHDTL